MGSDTTSDTNSASDAGSDEVASPRQYMLTLRLQLTIIPGPYGWFGRPFKALLLVQQPNEKNERITAENEVGLSGLGTNVALKNIRTRDFETL